MTQQQARWFVVQTQPNAETKATTHLVRQGFECYLPRFLKRRRHARKLETVAKALFPRYIFVAVDDTQRWRVIHSTLGVSRLLCVGGEPAPVPPDIIESLRKREDAAGFIKLEQRPSFSLGDKVRVLEGALGGAVGLYEGQAANDRVLILLDLLGRKSRVIVPGETIAAA